MFKFERQLLCYSIGAAAKLVSFVVHLSALQVFAIGNPFGLDHTLTTGDEGMRCRVL